MADRNQKYGIAKDFKRLGDLTLGGDTRDQMEKALVAWSWAGDVTMMQMMMTSLGKTNALHDIQAGIDRMNHQQELLVKRLDDIEDST